MTRKPRSQQVFKASLNFPPSPIIPSFDSAGTTGPTSGELAMALARLEGERYQRILPSEYMAHAGNLPSSSPNLTAAIALNQRINNWVQSSILDIDFNGAPNEIESKSIAKRFFVRTAEVARTFEIRQAWSSLTNLMHRHVVQSTTSHRWVRLWGRYSPRPSVP